MISRFSIFMTLPIRTCVLKSLFVVCRVDEIALHHPKHIDTTFVRLEMIRIIRYILDTKSTLPLMPGYG